MRTAFYEPRIWRSTLVLLMFGSGTQAGELREIRGRVIDERGRLSPARPSPTFGEPMGRARIRMEVTIPLHAAKNGRSHRVNVSKFRIFVLSCFRDSFHLTATRQAPDSEAIFRWQNDAVSPGQVTLAFTRRHGIRHLVLPFPQLPGRNHPRISCRYAALRAPRPRNGAGRSAQQRPAHDFCAYLWIGVSGIIAFGVYLAVGGGKVLP